MNSHLRKRPEEARESLSRSLELEPNNAFAMLMLGALHAFMGNGEEAVSLADKAMALSPLDPHNYLYHSLSATCRLAAEDWDGAVAAAERSMRANRGHISNYRVKTIALQNLGRDEAAAKEVERLMRLDPGLTVKRYLENHPAAAYGAGGDWAEALGRAGVPMQ